MNIVKITRQIIGTFKCTWHNCREVLTSWRPLSSRVSHLQTCHIGGIAVIESVRTAGWRSWRPPLPSLSTPPLATLPLPCGSYTFSNLSGMFVCDLIWLIRVSLGWNFSPSLLCAFNCLMISSVFMSKSYPIFDPISHSPPSLHPRFYSLH